MRFRSVVGLVLAAMAGSALLTLWVVRVPKPPAAQAEDAPAVVVDQTLAAGEYMFQGSKYTKLSTTEPDGLPEVHPYGGLNRSGQAAIPVDTEPAIWSNDWQTGLTREQVKMYAEGLVRSGLEDLNMCKPGYTCHGTVNYRVYEQNRSDLPSFLTLQMSFTTPTAHTELFLLVHENRGKVWGMTDAGWNFMGVVEELPENQQNMVYKLMSSSHLDDIKN